MKAIKVGWYTLHEKRVFRSTFECAAWYEDVEVQPGTYDVLAYPTWTNIGHALYVQAEGMVTGAYFGSLYGGRAIGPDRGGPERIGKIAKASIRLAPYCRAGEETFSIDPNVVEWDYSEVPARDGRDSYTLKSLRLIPS